MNLSRLLILLSLLGSLVACRHTRRRSLVSTVPVCAAPPHAPRDQRRPQDFSSARNRPAAIPIVSCFERQNPFIVEYWQDFDAAREEHRRVLRQFAQDRGFDPHLYTVGPMVDRLIAQAVLDHIHGTRQRLYGQQRVDNYEGRWSPESEWYEAYDLKLQIHVRIVDVAWNQLCDTSDPERWPDLSHFRETAVGRTYTGMRVAAGCDGNELEISYDSNIRSPLTEPEWRVGATMPVITYAWTEGTPLETMLFNAELVNRMPR